ncbi:Demethylmenaquinone methyltransferase [Pseudomonas sp. GM18]|uniref:RraA family protein n=1 Tax=Pseudomonas sp. GM18 TaxID=1144324 RepID=UPI0002727C3C|nr:demethylmenaquinone methyltransferase [Pseudomonas sp. GM18]EJM13487.1 Demethylmenaquinone methyltransferase [Pseudomonas sp. GM18]
MDESRLIEQLNAVSFPTLGHFLEVGFADSQLRAMVPNVKLVGRALTLKLVGADAIAVNQALALIQPGDVLVIDTDGDWQHAPVGAVTSCAASCAGAVGIVVDGAVTDLLELREAGLPVFARGTSLLTTKLHGRGDSQINQPIHCAGVTVHPGDLVLADDNGVLFLDPATAQDVIERALASDRAEPQLLTRLMAGEPVSSVLNINLS